MQLFWSAVAERSGNTAFDRLSGVRCLPSAVRRPVGERMTPWFLEVELWIYQVVRGIPEKLRAE